MSSLMLRLLLIAVIAIQVFAGQALAMPFAPPGPTTPAQCKELADELFAEELSMSASYRSCNDSAWGGKFSPMSVEGCPPGQGWTLFSQCIPQLKAYCAALMHSREQNNICRSRLAKDKKADEAEGKESPLDKMLGMTTELERLSRLMSEIEAEGSLAKKLHEKAADTLGAIGLIVTVGVVLDDEANAAHRIEAAMSIYADFAFKEEHALARELYGKAAEGLVETNEAAFAALVRQLEAFDSQQPGADIMNLTRVVKREVKALEAVVPKEEPQVQAKPQQVATAPTAEAPVTPPAEQPAAPTVDAPEAEIDLLETLHKFQTPQNWEACMAKHGRDACAAAMESGYEVEDEQRISTFAGDNGPISCFDDDWLVLWSSGQSRVHRCRVAKTYTTSDGMRCAVDGIAWLSDKGAVFSCGSEGVGNKRPRTLRADCDGGPGADYTSFSSKGCYSYYVN